MRGTPTPVNSPAFATDSADNSTVTITVAAVAGVTHVLKWLSWSFTATPGANVSVLAAVGGVLQWGLEIVEGGPGQKHFPNGLYVDENKVLVVTLEASGTGGIVGRLNVKTV